MAEVRNPIFFVLELLGHFCDSGCQRKASVFVWVCTSKLQMLYPFQCPILYVLLHVGIKTFQLRTTGSLNQFFLTVEAFKYYSFGLVPFLESLILKAFDFYSAVRGKEGYYTTSYCFCISLYYLH